MPKTGTAKRAPGTRLTVRLTEGDEMNLAILTGAMRMETGRPYLTRAAALRFALTLAATEAMTPEGAE